MLTKFNELGYIYIYMHINKETILNNCIDKKLRNFTKSLSSFLVVIIINDDSHVLLYGYFLFIV